MTDLRSALQDVYDQHGKLTPRLVVDVARPDSHPLHPFVFDRDVPDAAEAYYRERARYLIRSIRVSYREPGEESFDVRQWYAVREEGPDEIVFAPLERVINDDFTQRLVLRDAEREWRQLYARYAHLKEFLAMVRGDIEAAS